MRKTTKLIEGGHCGLQDYRHYYLYVFYVFSKASLKIVTFYVFLPCFVRFVELCCVCLSVCVCLCMFSCLSVDMSVCLSGHVLLVYSNLC